MTPVLSLAIKSMLNRRFAVLLTIFSVAITIMLLVGVERLRHEARQSFANTISATDLIIGARSGPVQLLLYSVFRIGDPTNNMTWKSYQQIRQHPQVAWAVPISLGDSHRGYRVLGTTIDYFEHYRFANKQSLSFAEGQQFTNLYDAVIGADIASELHYHLGQKMILAHGRGAIIHEEHSDKPFRVVGILEKTGTPVDRTIHVDLRGMQAIHHQAPDKFIQSRQSIQTQTDNDPHAATHNHDHDDDHNAEHAEHEDHAEHQEREEHNKHAEHEHKHEKPLDEDEHRQHEHAADTHHQDEHDFEPTQISAMLVGLKSRLAAFQLQRVVNDYEDEALTAILPGVALQQLWDTMAVAQQVLLFISAMVVLVGITGMATAILMTLNERRREMAVLRSLGARPVHIFSLFVGESVVIMSIASVIGLSMLYAIQLAARPLLQDLFGIYLAINAPTAYELTLIAAAFGTGILMGLLPAYRAYRYSLADGMTIKI